MASFNMSGQSVTNQFNVGDNETRHIPVSALWLRRIGDTVEVLIEVKGEWHKVMSEYVDASFSHITEAGGLQKILDTGKPEKFQAAKER